ncbi:head decoration protein [Alishewanella sp. SMS8]|uniref:head decoration protein n=1 Tax=unclassified Alishewanella TaxID=2628974 RepID=UPI0027403FF9|nr:head decoration protein [Alishewanella sp. SMS8]MDP5205798.1 head decoration protein [Alishewanella sp. SMS9]MDP5459884.1 head decoration protein [Alishewanella sp. SMS8]
MSQVTTELPRAGQYIKSEVGSISRDTILFTGGKFLPGEAFGIVASKAVKLDFAANSGAELAKGITYAYVDATAADVKGVYSSRLTEVNMNGLIWPATATAGQVLGAVAELAKNHIVVRG